MRLALRRLLRAIRRVIVLGDGLRLDAWLVQNGFASGREKAKELLATGQVWINGKPADKPSRKITATDQVVCEAPPPPYVGRGGYKLEKAIAEAGLVLEGVTAMDVGASTGGFTDCMLQHGAARVYAVDVGHDQLHPSLRSDPRVTVLEGTDVRSAALATAVPSGSVDVCSVDVSFVSLSHILPAVLPFLAEKAILVCLIKPQFEVGRSAVGKRGVVRDKREHSRVLQNLLRLFAEDNLCMRLLTYSPITGGEGNIEYLAVLQRAGETILPDPSAVVEAAFAALG